MRRDTFSWIMVIWVIYASWFENILPASLSQEAGRMEYHVKGLLHQYLTAVDDIDTLLSAAYTLSRQVVDALHNGSDSLIH